jgi:glycosyltransferase involved in cell wall biosynthesis
MKILMIAPQPFFQPRGTPLSVLHRLKALSSLGHHVDLVTYHIGEDVPINNVKIYRTLKVPFVKDIDIGPSFKKILCDIFLFFKAIKMLNKKKYDVLHTHEEAGFMAVLFKYIYKMPHLYDMHSSLPQQLSNFERGNIKIIVNIFKLVEKLTLRSSDGIITICPDLKKKVNVIDPGLNPVLIENVADNSIIFGEDKGQDTVANMRKKYNIPVDKKVVLYTGTFEKYQGIELLLKAARICLKDSNEIAIVLVGGKKEQVERMKKISRDYGIADKVIFAGNVHPKEIMCFYEIATIIASPRIQGTNSPLKIYSYLRSGRPILATNCYTHTQVLNDKMALIVEPNPEDFAQGILRLIGDQELCDSLVSQAKKTAETKYSYDEYLKKTANVYKNIGLQKNKRENRFIA